MAKLYKREKEYSIFEFIEFFTLLAVFIIMIFKAIIYLLKRSFEIFANALEFITKKSSNKLLIL